METDGLGARGVQLWIRSDEPPGNTVTRTRQQQKKGWKNDSHVSHASYKRAFNSCQNKAASRNLKKFREVLQSDHFTVV